MNCVYSILLAGFLTLLCVVDRVHRSEMSEVLQH